MKKVQNHTLIYLPLSDLQYGDFHQSAMEEMQKSPIFRTFFTALWSIFVVAQIGEQVNRRMILYIICMHHFVIWSVAKFLMRNDIVGSRWKPVYIVKTPVYIVKTPVYIVKTPVYPPHHFPLTGDEAAIDGDTTDLRSYG